MPESKQDFFWFELMTTDLDAAARFYSDVVGWKMSEVGSPHMRYLAGGMPETRRAVVGLMTLPPEASANNGCAGWTGYIHTENVDAATAGAEKAGACVLHAPEDIPGVGRMSFLMDPQGALFHLMQPKPQGEAPPPLAANTVGSVGWYELGAKNWETAWNFYANEFGWTKSDALDMGEMGAYQMFATNDEPMSGGMMTLPEPALAKSGNRANWVFYFVVDGISQAKERAELAGAKVMMGPLQVPGDTWVMQAIDPQGAIFALMSMKP